MSDRTVHARLPDGTQVVRYSRAGKWYSEKGDERRHLTFVEALQLARTLGAYVYLHQPGGNAFDRLVSK
jgi:hypothetical protein